MLSTAKSNCPSASAAADSPPAGQLADGREHGARALGREVHRAQVRGLDHVADLVQLDCLYAMSCVRTDQSGTAAGGANTVHAQAHVLKLGCKYSREGRGKGEGRAQGVARLGQRVRHRGGERERGAQGRPSLHRLGRGLLRQRAVDAGKFALQTLHLQVSQYHGRQEELHKWVVCSRTCAAAARLHTTDGHTSQELSEKIYSTKYGKGGAFEAPHIQDGGGLTSRKAALSKAVPAAMQCQCYPRVLAPPCMQRSSAPLLQSSPSAQGLE